MPLHRGPSSVANATDEGSRTNGVRDHQNCMRAMKFLPDTVHDLKKYFLPLYKIQIL